MIQSQPTLISIFTNFHILNIPSEIGGYGTLIFQALLWKANQLRYPITFKMSNGELCDHSGLKYNAMYQARQSLIDYRYNEIELITYVKGKKDEMATYGINYSIFLQEPNKNQTITEQEPDNNEIITEQEPDNNETITGHEKDNNDSMVIVQSLSKHPENQYTLRKDKIREEKTKKEYISPANEFENDNFIESSQDIYINQDQEGISGQVAIIKKAISDKYRLMPSDYNKPSYQFIKDLIELHADKGGMDYVLRKVDELPVPCETNIIGNTLRSWCERPEMGKGGIVKLEQKDRHIDVKAVWDDQDKMFSLITLGQIDFHDEFILIASRLTELYSKSPEESYGRLKEFFLDIKIEEFIKFHNERLARK